MQELDAMPQALQPVTGPAVWRPADFVHDHSWCHELSPDQAGQVARAARHWRGREFDALAREEARQALAGLIPLAERVTDELAGRGFALIRGVPVQHLSDEEARLAYWAIGLLFGVGLSQNAKADFLCPVTDMGVDFGYSGSASQHNVRGYQSRADLNYHCDPTDIVALLCLRQALSGGISTIVSTPAVFNEIRASHPEHLPTLLRGFPYDRKGEGWASEAPVTPRIPVFAHHGGRVSCRYARSYILGGAQKLGQPLTSEERAALDCFDAVAHREDMVMHMEFRPGDIQLLNNYTVVHGRTSYEDDPDPARRRFLYRLWLQIDRAPWTEEDEVMRWAFARFGNLGRTTSQWRALDGGAP